MQCFFATTRGLQVCTPFGEEISCWAKCEAFDEANLDVMAGPSDLSKGEAVGLAQPVPRLAVAGVAVPAGMSLGANLRLDTIVSCKILYVNKY
jgi:hypothetical protein